MAEKKAAKKETEEVEEKKSKTSTEVPQDPIPDPGVQDPDWTPPSQRGEPDPGVQSD